MAAILLGLVFFFGSETSFRARYVGNGPFQLMGKEAPDMEFKYSSGEQSSIREGKGKVILVNFWASWCEPCMKEMPSLKILESHFSSRGLVLLAFNVGEVESEVRGQLEGKELPRNLIFSFDKAQMRQYAVSSLPISILIGRGGMVRRIYEGAHNWAEARYLREIEAELR